MEISFSSLIIVRELETENHEQSWPASVYCLRSYRMQLNESNHMRIEGIFMKQISYGDYLVLGNLDDLLNT